jgi:hypothetical protein
MIVAAFLSGYNLCSPGRYRFRKVPRVYYLLPVWKSVISGTATRILNSAGEVNLKSGRSIEIKIIMMILEELMKRAFYTANILLVSQ